MTVGCRHDATKGGNFGFLTTVFLTTVKKTIAKTVKPPMLSLSRMFLLIENYPESKTREISINKNMSETEKKLSEINSAAWEIRCHERLDSAGVAFIEWGIFLKISAPRAFLK
ncbi:hypothetical protein NQ317_009006 [Molorchus minor]|uniref:Uncharacterized protein n=1 Tax=Molorchus minor TaxID=1323400 RepID=A0ABQ9JN80_9CUCU|nr:hypothetical protein NQ317_009006 [Molorchus minor]